MFQPTQILRNEHDVILRALGVLENCCQQIEDGKQVSPDTMDALIEFFRLYADRCHHGKEEDLLFPAMEAKGVPREGGPIGCMLHEHENNRALVRRMAEASAQLRGGDASAAQRWSAAAAEYASGLNDHIYKENQILFVMAERIFTAVDEPAMMASFTNVDVNQVGRGEIARLETLVDSLMAKEAAR